MKYCSPLILQQTSHIFTQEIFKNLEEGGVDTFAIAKNELAPQKCVCVCFSFSTFFVQYTC
jgi:hypothetical protein